MSCSGFVLMPWSAAPPAGRHSKGGTFPRQFHLSSRSKDYNDGEQPPPPRAVPTYHIAASQCRRYGLAVLNLWVD